MRKIIKIFFGILSFPIGTATLITFVKWSAGLSLPENVFIKSFCGVILIMIGFGIFFTTCIVAVSLLVNED